VRVLLAAHADVNAQTGKGETALISASGKGHLEVVRALLAAHADVNAKMRKGTTAFIIAKAHGHFDVVDAVVAAGAEPNPGDGQTEIGSCGPNPPKAEGLAISIYVAYSAGADSEMQKVSGNVRTIYSVNHRTMTMEEEGVRPGGPLFIWIIREISNSAQLFFKEANLNVENGQVYTWATNGDKIFPDEAGKELKYLCNFDQTLDDDELQALFLKKLPEADKDSKKTGNTRYCTPIGSTAGKSIVKIIFP